MRTREDVMTFGRAGLQANRDEVGEGKGIQEQEGRHGVSAHMRSGLQQEQSSFLSIGRKGEHGDVDAGKLEDSGGGKDKEAILSLAK